MADFCMPALGADMEAGTLVAWRRKPGDQLARGDVIAEVETDKGVIEVEVFEPGVLERYLVEPGQRVPVGTPLAVLSGPMSASVGSDVAAAAAVALPAAAEVAPPPVAVAASPQPQRLSEAEHGSMREVPLTPSLRRRARELGVSPQALFTAGPPHEAPRLHTAAPSGASSLRSSPAARVRAQQLGIELVAGSGSGPDGAIVLADVERWASARDAGDQRAPAIAAADKSGDAQARLRRAIGAAMARSKREIPHYYLATTIDFARAASWLAARNLETSVHERILPAALLLKAVARAAHQLPDFNAVWRDGQLDKKPEVNLGVAVALRGGGLIAPAIARADTLELLPLMQRLADLVQRARAGTLRSSELSDGTLTVTSLGERGVEAVFPIIYAPQTAIVGFGKIAERPWVVDSVVQARPLVTASLAADHRVTDGHLGARFLNLIDSLLQEPEHL